YCYLLWLALSQSAATWMKWLVLWHLRNFQRKAIIVHSTGVWPILSYSVRLNRSSARGSINPHHSSVATVLSNSSTTACLTYSHLTLLRYSMCSCPTATRYPNSQLWVPSCHSTDITANSKLSMATRQVTS